MEPHLLAQQAVQLSPVDDSIFTRCLQQAKVHHFETLSIGRRVAAVGKLFLGTPYVAGTLDTSASKEHLIVNLPGFDCVTFYENSLAFARTLSSPHKDLEAEFTRWLTCLRYRDGVERAYDWRLHYTTDYFYNAQHKGILRDVTRELGGARVKLDQRTINFMSEHRTAYKQLATNNYLLNAIKNVETTIKKRGGFYYIPKGDIEQIESKIEPGDIIGITTDIPGLDCSHTGIATREADGRIHFMHASSLMSKVIITEVPLVNYLTQSPHQTGIVIARPLMPMAKL